MWERFRILGLLGAALIAGNIVSYWPDSSGQAVGQQDRRAADLRERLTTGLQVRRQSEQAFIDEIVQRVETGHIPQSLVDSTFFWVRENRGDHEYPFFYFERILRMRGRRAGVTIPAFP